ncbi:MAG TPA: hypothetical protein VM266_14350 [Solirubrobacteraceae bacterium]|nr:hypothetical protein [Solirubrobacteraceae bacterium]
MPVAALIALAIIAVLLVLVCAALVEVFRQLNELRAVTQLDDRPIPLTLDARTRARRLPLPAPIAEAPQSAVVILSHECATCVAIAEELGREPLPTLWFTVVGGSRADSRVQRALAGQGDHRVDGLADVLRDELGVDVIPAVLTFEFGELRHAYAVSSTRQVNALMPTVFALGSRRAGPDPDAPPVPPVAVVHHRG